MKSTRFFAKFFKSAKQQQRNLFLLQQQQQPKQKLFTAAAFLSGAAAVALGWQWYKNDSKDQQYDLLSVAEAEEKKKPLIRTLDGVAPVYKVVLTGGPCGGKTSAMTVLTERLKALGFQVFVVTEIATLLLTGGASFRPDMDTNELLAFEGALIKTQIAIEDAYLEIARSSQKPTILLIDRGVMDPKAYVKPDIWSIMLDTNNWSAGKLRDARYDCIIHLVTAAIGAEKFYTKVNNAARSEDVSQARFLDNKLREAYLGHPNLFIIDNSTNFETKIQRVLNVVSHLIGLPKPTNSLRKYRVKGSIKNSQINIPYECTELEQLLLRVDDPNVEQKRLRKSKAADGSMTYTLTAKVFTEDKKEASVIFNTISGKTHMALASQQMPNTTAVRKHVRSFLYKEHYFNLVTYLVKSEDFTDPANPTVLTVEASNDTVIEFPPFLQNLIGEDVTVNDKFSTFGLSKKN